MKTNKNLMIVRPIGYVTDGVIQIHERWVKGLEGIEKFSHVIVLFWLHQAKQPKMKIHPKGIKALPKIGFLATRAPHRLNPVGVTVMRLRKRRGCKLWVKGLDVWNDTPVIDIKPYTKKESVKRFSVPEWVRRLYKLEAGSLRKYGN